MRLSGKSFSEMTECFIEFYRNLKIPWFSLKFCGLGKTMGPSDKPDLFHNLLLTPESQEYHHLLVSTKLAARLQRQLDVKNVP